MARPSGKALNPDAFRDILEGLPESPTAAAIANAAGISPSTLSELLAGTTRASDRTATELALAMRCRRATLFPEYVNFGARPRPEAEPAEVPAS